jgi:hypothetical protein
MRNGLSCWLEPARGAIAQQVRKTIKMDVNLRRVMANSSAHPVYYSEIEKRIIEKTGKPHIR